MTGADERDRLLKNRVVWALTALIATGLVALLRVSTHLGVKVVEAATTRSGSIPSNLDFRGSEYVWRVWWRARDDLIDVSPSWLLTVVLLAGLVVFVVGIFAAYRIALSIPSSPPPRDV